MLRTPALYRCAVTDAIMPFIEGVMIEAYEAAQEEAAVAAEQRATRF